VGQFDVAAMLPCFAPWNVIEWAMLIKPLEITEMDIQRARRIERSLAPKDLSEGQAEYVVRAIAQGIAQGRQQGLELAKALND
jgi:hypothetical protein